MSCKQDADCKSQWKPDAVCLGQQCYVSGKAGLVLNTFSEQFLYQYYMFCTFFADAQYTTKTAWMVPIVSGVANQRIYLLMKHQCN